MHLSSSTVKSTTASSPTVSSVPIFTTSAPTNSSLKGLASKLTTSIITTIMTPPPAITEGDSSAHHPSLFINTSAPITSEVTSASDAHSRWSGFYKKTIKERRTQLGLAYPHLTRPSSLDAFASTQTSARTSGRSTPNFGRSTPNLGPNMRSLAMTNIPRSASPSPLMTTSIAMPRPVPLPLTTSAKSSLLKSTDNPATLSQESDLTDNSHDTINPNQETLPSEEIVITAETVVRPKESSLTEDQFRDQLRFQFQQAEKERQALVLELGQGQEDVVMTEEEQREQFEKERRANGILNLEEQRKMIGSPNGHLLEGDLSLNARLNALIAAEQEGTPFPVHGLDEQIANNMIENCIGTLGLPLGLAFNFTINSSPLTIPMSIEEPSVVAAVSSAAKTISTYHGFQAWAPERNMIVAQVQLVDIPDSRMDRVMAKMQEHEKSIQEEANEYCINMVKRGGGVQRISFHRIRRHVNRESFKGQNLLVKYGVVSAESLPARDSSNSSQGRCSEWLLVHLHIDVGDAMGANCANTVAEGIAPFLAKLSGGRVGVRILSNLNVDRIAKSKFRLPFSHMGYKSLSGKDVAVRILEAYEWADLDPYRAATHNKGIMNGIDAVALATGQDWRAVEAGAHAWASGAGTYSERSTDAISTRGTSPSDPVSTHINGNGNGNGSKRKFEAHSEEAKVYRGDAYKPLTRYWIEEDEDRLQQGFTGQDALVFCGELEMPIMVGTKGGVLSTNPVHAFTLGVMRYPDSKQLAMAMVTVGLAQNFAALRALATEGIQRGHMALHARNIAISAGTPPASVDEVTAYMIDTGKIRLGAAKSYIEKRGLLLYSSGLSANSSSTSLLGNGANVQ
ncbi:hypothetical protein BGX26_003562 [Mortierella sp. AD094]|nr:hypothetical protein BGX26_003562 [Mortierella sp. AD094]